MQNSRGIIDINVDTIDVCSMLGVGLVWVRLGWVGLGLEEQGWLGWKGTSKWPW